MQHGKKKKKKKQKKKPRLSKLPSPSPSSIRNQHTEYKYNNTTQDLPPEEVPYLAIPLHTVIKVTPKAYGCAEKRYKMMV